MRSREAWRWLTFALPPDMLLAALGDARGSPTRVEMLSPQLEENLHRRGFAEAHLHVNAGLDFPLLWTSAMHGLKSDQLDETAFRSPGADLNEGRNFGNWLLRVALARYLLAAFLRRRAVTSSETLRLVEFFEAVRGELYDRLGSHGGNVLQDALRDLDRGEFVGMATYADLRECCRFCWNGFVD